MLEGNAEKELALLSASGVLGSAVSKAIGVPQIKRLLNGEIDRPTCEEEIVIATRQYAKRQRSWFRREQWLTAVPGCSLSSEIITKAKQILKI